MCKSAQGRSTKQAGLMLTPSQAAQEAAAAGGGGGGGTFRRQVHAPDLRILLQQLPQLLGLLQSAREGCAKTPEPMANMQRAAAGHAGAAAAALTRWGGMREIYTMPRRSYFSLSFFSFFALRSGSLGAWRSSCCSWSLMAVWQCVGLAAAPPYSPRRSRRLPRWHGMLAAPGASKPGPQSRPALATERLPTAPFTSACTTGRRNKSRHGPHRPARRDVSSAAILCWSARRRPARL